MSKKLSFSIAVNLLTENFKKGTNTVKSSLKSMQMQVLTFAAALGAGGLGLSGLISRFRDTARETNMATTALKNVSAGTRGFADNLGFVNELANKYGLGVNSLIGNFAKFTVSASQANMPMEEQKRVFESLSRSCTAFALSAENTDSVFLALTQMMGKGKISMEELRRQMGQHLPVAMSAMARALGVSMGEMEKLVASGNVMSADVIPKFAQALNEMIPNVSTDNLEASLNRLRNAFVEIVNASGFQGKYKALVDWLTGLIQAAGKNIQNIVVGVVAAIGFVVINGITKIYRGYKATGEQIVANAVKTHVKMQNLIADRVALKAKLDQLELQHAQATGAKQVSLAAQIERQKQLLSAKTTKINVAHEEAKAAAAQAAAIKSRGAWATAWATVTGGAKRMMSGLNALWKSFKPAIIISGLIAVGGYLKGLYDKTQRLQKATRDFNKDLATEQTNINILFNRLRKATEGTEEYDKAKSEIISKYGEYLKGLSDEVKSLKDVEGAYKAISAAALQAAKDRAIEKNTTRAYDKYTTAFADNATRLQKQLSKKFGKEEGSIIYDEILKSLNENRDIPEDVQRIIDGFKNTYYNREGGSTSHNPVEQLVNNIRVSKRQLNEELEGIKSAFGEISGAGAAESLMSELPTPESVNADLDNNALRIAEKKLEALRKLDEEDRKRQIEKQRFDLDMRQKEIDLLDDSFEKRTKQVLLNLDKEKVEIEKAQNELLKQQQEYAKNLFVSEHGTDKGFGAYFENLRGAGFKGAGGADVLPEGLRPEDITGMVNQMLAAAQLGFDKANEEIAKAIGDVLARERFVFEGELKQTIISIKEHYDELKRQFREGSDEFKALQALEGKELRLAQISHNRKLLDLNADLQEKQIGLTDKFYKFQSKREAELLRIRFQNNKDLIENLKEEFEVVTGLEFDSLPDDALDELIDKYPDLVAAIRGATLQQRQYNKELAKIPVNVLKELFDFADGLKVIDVVEQLIGKVKELAEISGDSKLFGNMEQLSSVLQNFKAAGEGAKSGGWIGAIVGGVSDIVTQTIDGFIDLKRQAKEAAQAVTDFYNILVLNSLKVNNDKNIFGESSISNAADAYRKAQDALGRYNAALSKSMELDNAEYTANNRGLGLVLGLLTGDAISTAAGVGTGMGKHISNEFAAALDAYNRGYTALQGMSIRTKDYNGWQEFWGKDDEYKSLKDLAPELWDADGQFNVENAKAFLETNKQINDTQRKQIQNIIDLKEAYDAAIETVRAELADTFGYMANDLVGMITDSIADASAEWGNFEDAGVKAIETLGKKLIYELFMKKKMDALMEDLEKSFDSGGSAEEIATRQMGLLSGFFSGFGQNMEAAKKFGEQWQELAKQYGFDIWGGAEDLNQTASAKGFQSMDQDTGNRLDGRFEALQMSGVKMEGLLSAIMVSGNNIYNMNSAMNAELQKHTNLFVEMREIQKNTYYRAEDIVNVLSEVPGILERIRENTSRI